MGVKKKKGLQIEMSRNVRNNNGNTLHTPTKKKETVVESVTMDTLLASIKVNDLDQKLGCKVCSSENPVYQYAAVMDGVR